MKSPPSFSNGHRRAMPVAGRSRDKGDGDGDDKFKATTTTNTATDMKTMYSMLQSMVPGINPKASKENILFETTEYIKLLEKERARLENLKRTLDQLDRASSPADGRGSSRRIQFAASSNIALFEIEASDGETSLTDIFNAIHQAGAEILMANITAREGRKRIIVTAIVGDEDLAIDARQQ